AHVLAERAGKPDEVDAEMLEEAAVLGGEHRVDDVRRHLVDRHRIALDDAALADLVAVAVEEGDRELALAAPVAGRLVEGGQRQREQQDRRDGAEREALAQKFEEGAAPALELEPAEEDGEPLPEFGEAEARVIECGIDPCVEVEQPGRSWPLGLFRLERVFHANSVRTRPQLSTGLGRFWAGPAELPSSHEPGPSDKGNGMGW